MFLLKIVRRGCPVGNDSLTILRNSFPRLVFTDILYGGLYHNTFLLLLFCLSVLFFGSGSYLRVYLCPLSESAFWYTPAALSKDSLSEDMQDRRLFTPFGIAIMVAMGWLLLVFT